MRKSLLFLLLTLTSVLLVVPTHSINVGGVEKNRIFKQFIIKLYQKILLILKRKLLRDGRQKMKKNSILILKRLSRRIYCRRIWQQIMLLG